MRYEWERVLRFPALWTILGISLGIRSVLCVYDRMHRLGAFWDLAASYWEIIGSISLVMIILLAPIRLFTDDKHYHMEEMILTTRKGRFLLLMRRYTICLLFASILPVLLSISNLFISVIIGGNPEIDMTAYWIKTIYASLGGAGLALVAGALCDVLRSHPATIIICGSFTLVGFMIRGSMVGPFEFLWFLKYGFFAPILRGQINVVWEGWLIFWIIWHISITALFIILDISKRRERKAL